MDEPLHNMCASIAARIDPPSAQRRLIALASPPAAGKTTLAQALVAHLANQGRDVALMTMDGYHLDNRLLEPRGLLPRKGAPETFDADGFAMAIHRIAARSPMVVPVFDRKRDIAIAGAGEVGTGPELVVVEGNYLLLDEEPWRKLSFFWSLSVYLDVPEELLIERLVRRWLEHGLDTAAARLRCESTDLPNARRIAAARLPPDLILTT